MIVETGDAASTLSEGWAQVTSNQSINGTAIFRYDPWSQEAAVPLLTSGGTKLECRSAWLWLTPTLRRPRSPTALSPPTVDNRNFYSDAEGKA